MKLKNVYKKYDIVVPYLFESNNFSEIIFLESVWYYKKLKEIEIEDPSENLMSSKFLISNEILGSNTIEGEYSSRKDISKIIKETHLNENSLINEKTNKVNTGIEFAQNYLNSKNIINVDLLTKAYDILTFNGDILEENSKHHNPYRNDFVGIFENATSEKIHSGTDHKDIEKSMNDLFKFINSDELNDCPILKASVSHHVFETIHPYFDGNGRTGRLIFNWMINKLTGSSVEGISLVINQTKNNYYQAIEDSRKTKSFMYIYTYYLEIISINNKIVGFLNENINLLSNTELYVYSLILIKGNSIKNFKWDNVNSWLPDKDKMTKQGMLKILNSLLKNKLLKSEMIKNNKFFSIK